MGYLKALERKDRLTPFTILKLTVVLISKVTLRIAKWAMVRKELSNFNFNDIFFSCEACMGCAPDAIVGIQSQVPGHN